MGLTRIASLVTDPYERAARLYPAMLALLPLLAVFLTTSAFNKPLATQAVTLLGACGVTYLLASVSRMLGKSRESGLFVAWGGTPTTQMLRHRDQRVDRHTKQRYHTLLARKLKTQFPSSEEEAASPAEADELYRAAVKWLLGKTRDKKRFALLFKENVSYGFHRNGHGLRWVGFLIGIVALAWLVVANAVYSAEAWLSMPAAQIVTLGLVIAMMLAWIFYFTEARVQQAAFAYAEMLLRACDEMK
jgi:hypothetical protein